MRPAPPRGIRRSPRIYRRVGPNGRSGCPAVISMHRDIFELEIFEAADIDGGGGNALAIGTLAKRQDAAVPAEPVPDDVLVERVGGQFRLTRKLHLLARHEPQQRAALRADGAVAGHRLGDLAFDFEGDFAAMASTAIFHVTHSRVSVDWHRARAAIGRQSFATRTGYGLHVRWACRPAAS